MRKNRYFNEHIEGLARWHNRAISPAPLRFDSTSDMRKQIVVIHPGWGKRPELLGKLLFSLAEAGFMPIGVDTRYGYANSNYRSDEIRDEHIVARLLKQQYRVGDLNPYFNNVSSHRNRYELRRPSGLAALLVSLGIENAYMIGHSEGGRIVTTVAAHSTDVVTVPKLIAVNSVGVGDSGNGILGFLRSNAGSNELFGGSIDYPEAITSALGSMAFGLTHPRRFMREKAVIQTANIWPLLNDLAERGTKVTVMHALNDQLVRFEEERAAERHSDIEVIRTPGGHSNIYTPEVTNQIVARLCA